MSKCALIATLLAISAVVSFAALTPVAIADPLDDAREALSRGDGNAAEMLLRPLAETENAVAEGLLGFLYESGNGVPKDDAQALSWYRRSADHGNPASQTRLGELYLSGRAVPQDYGEAARWFKGAAAQGYAPAQRALGLLYYQGQGVHQDYSESANWYRKAADAGDANAQYNLGVLYCQGQGVLQDCSEAAKWYRRAAEQGYRSAQNNLGGLYAQGKGVPQDFVLAYAWFSFAAQGMDRAADNVANISNDMTPEQLVEAKELVKALPTQATDDSCKTAILSPDQPSVPLEPSSELPIWKISNGGPALVEVRLNDSPDVRFDFFEIPAHKPVSVFGDASRPAALWLSVSSTKAVVTICP